MSAVKDLRERLDLTQDQLADMVGANTGTVSRNEGKEPKGWSAVPFFAIAKEKRLDDIASRLRELCRAGIPKCVWPLLEDHPALVAGKHLALREIPNQAHQQEHAMLEDVLEHGDPEAGMVVDMLRGAVKRINKQKAERRA